MPVTDNYVLGTVRASPGDFVWIVLYALIMASGLIWMLFEYISPATPNLLKPSYEKRLLDSHSKTNLLSLRTLLYIVIAALVLFEVMGITIQDLGNDLPQPWYSLPTLEIAGILFCLTSIYGLFRDNERI